MRASHTCAGQKAEISTQEFAQAAAVANVLWAQVKGYPFWPAQVMSDAAAKEKAAQLARQPNPQNPAVMFFGTSEVAWVPERNTRAWPEALDPALLQKGLKRKAFAAASTRCDTGWGPHQVTAFLGPKSQAPDAWWMGQTLAGKATAPSPAASGALPRMGLSVSGAKGTSANSARSGATGPSRSDLQPTVKRPKSASTGATSKSGASKQSKGMGKAEASAQCPGSAAGDDGDIAADSLDGHRPCKRQRSNLGPDATTSGDGSRYGTESKSSSLQPGHSDRSGPVRGRPSAGPSRLGPKHARRLVQDAAPASSQNGVSGAQPSAASKDGVDAELMDTDTDQEKQLPQQLLPRLPLSAQPKMPKWDNIKRNIWVGRKRPKRLPKADIHVCECRPAIAAPVPADAKDEAQQSQVRVSSTRQRVNGSGDPKQEVDSEPCGDHCLNRAVHVFCDALTCPCAASCTNRPFNHQASPKMEVFLTPNRGWGVRAEEPIAKGTFVIEYCGEVIDEAEAQHRTVVANSQGLESFYLMELQPGCILDARTKGSVARFFNSSCGPNCETQKWHDAATGEVRIGVFAKDDIPVGGELTYDYKFQHYGLAAAAGAYRCLCGAPNCRGTMDPQPERKRDFGRRVEVYWPDDVCYYRATVVNYSIVSGKHHLHYDDGYVERIVLKESEHRWLEDSAPPKPEPIREGPPPDPFELPDLYQATSPGGPVSSSPRHTHFTANAASAGTMPFSDTADTHPPIHSARNRALQSRALSSSLQTQDGLRGGTHPLLSSLPGRHAQPEKATGLQPHAAQPSASLQLMPSLKSWAGLAEKLGMSGPPASQELPSAQQGFRYGHEGYQSVLRGYPISSGPVTTMPVSPEHVRSQQDQWAGHSEARMGATQQQWASRSAAMAGNHGPQAERASAMRRHPSHHGPAGATHLEPPPTPGAAPIQVDRNRFHPPATDDVGMSDGQGQEDSCGTGRGLQESPHMGAAGRGLCHGVHLSAPSGAHADAPAVARSGSTPAAP
ncbi:hypothetical protein WJX84_010200 [Apatococcus fuscideae]|uniref:Histone-lysine N-methyltransferase n=1 Tax=Apatococcus fuscideae TaxID=2026836 RepID=A0AAW1T1I4_9CHLO